MVLIVPKGQATSLENPSSIIDNVLLNLIANSRDILKCQDDSDDEFVPYSQKTLDRAIELLTSYVKSGETVLGTGSSVPKILPGPSGSIDLHWKNEKKELVVNIPADPNANAMFYGDDYGKLYIKGSIKTNALHPAILMWLISD